MEFTGKIQGQSDMRKGRVCRVFIALTTIFVLTLCCVCSCLASDIKQFDLNDGEVVFLLDTSVSMNKQDKDRMAVDAVKQALYSLPENYQAGLVTYNTGIQTIISFGEDTAQWDEALNEIVYFGYTNAGEALQQAIGMFSDREDVNRYIVMLTDGEIDMPTSQEKDSSRLQYEEAVQEAKARGIKEYIIAIGSDWNESEIHIFDGAEITDGAIYWDGQSGSVSEIMNRILYERLCFPGRTLDVSEESGGKISVNLPALGAEYVKILLLTEQEMPDISVECDAETSIVHMGRNFAVINIENPIGQVVEISYDPADVSGMKAYMQIGYKAEIETQVTYRREMENGTGQQEAGETLPEYIHFADVEISLKGPEGNLWDNEYYEGLEIPFAVNGIPAIGNIHNGSILYSMQIEDLQEAVVELDVRRLPEHYEIQQPVTITFTLPEYPQPEVEQKLDYRPLWIILGVLALSLAVLLALGIKRERKTKIYVAQPQTSGNIVKKEEIKGCAFTGKLNIYVLQTQTGDDVPPQTYRLFGRQAARIPLSQVLDLCEIKFGKIGAENVIFCAGPDKTLIAMDQSEKCTVLRGTEILKKGVGYPVYYNGKLTVIFEDGITEVEIHYKSIKPSERENI